jgi:hypothetical protein
MPGGGSAVGTMRIRSGRPNKGIMAVETGGATGYQTLINGALREYLEGKVPKFEETLRRIIREELKSSAT